MAALHYLTDALYASLCYHCRIEDPEQSKLITLPYGHARSSPSTIHRSPSTELVPFPPNDPQRGDTFAERIKALLRRHVVERCIYGVDINSLAVEFARVSLWVETLDPELPFSFLDHKIKVGNSLVGCWLDRVEDYPLKAWEREGGDGKDGPRTLRIEEFLKGEKIGNRRSGDGRIKKEMRQVIDSRFTQQASLFPGETTTTESVVALARTEYEQLHDLPIGDPDERERFYREHIERSQPLSTLTAAMDEWCAVWFWPTDEDSLRYAPTPLTFHKPCAEKDALVKHLADGVKFFHWELEFPDVFTPERSGFDATIGNPPWDVMKPNSQEFFTEFDPLYRTYDKQTALRKQKELFATLPALAELWDEYIARFKALGNWARNAAEPFDLTLVRGKEGDNLKSAWARHRQDRVGFADTRHPFCLQGSADLNSYKMFAEFFWSLLRPDGRLGVILPTGIYSDFGTKDLREELLLRGRLDFLFAFQNEKKLFPAVFHGYKFVALFCAKGGSTQKFRTRFRMGVGDSPHAHELPDDILNRDDSAMCFTPADIKQNSPKTLSLVEIRTKRDLDIFRKIYAHSIRIGDNAPGWEITYACEFHMTNDSKHFPPLEKWEAKGYKPDVFGRWIGPDGDVALPLYQGRVVHHFDFWKVGYVSGKGSNAVWRNLPLDSKCIEPMNLMSLETFRSFGGNKYKSRVVFRDIARNTDTRTMIGCCIPEMPCNNKVPILSASASLPQQLILSAILCSLSFDWCIRQRLTSASLNWFIVEECPLPHLPLIDSCFHRLVLNTARLTFLHRRFAPEWLWLAHLFPDIFGFDPLSTVHRPPSPTQWKHWWAVTEADRLRLRIEIDALCADLYGLDPDDYDWIVRDDPSDPKGFYRVDRYLPFRERLTGLSAAAFRALKEGKWTVNGGRWTEEGKAMLSTVHRPPSTLSNDEFFEILGIPEMTTGPDPLIEKRDGCHRWKPEEFGKDDPRHGWTWDHCWQDAVTLLGSEEAVQKYIEGKSERATEQPSNDGPTDLFGQPLPPKQKKLF